MWIIQWIINNANAVYDLLANAGDFLRNLYWRAKDFVWRFFIDEIIGFFGQRDRAAGRAIAFFIDGINTLRDVYHQIWSTYNNWYGPLISGLAEITGWWKERIRNIVENLYGTLIWLHHSFFQFGNWLLTKARAFVEWLYNTAREFIEWLFHVARGFIEWLFNTARRFIEWLFNVARGFIEWLFNTARRFIEWLFNVARGFIEWLFNTARRFIEWLFNVARGFIEWLFNTARGFIEWLFNVARGFIEWLFNTARGFIEWLFVKAKGVLEFLVDIADKLTFVFVTAFDILKDFLSNPMGYAFGIFLSLFDVFLEWTIYLLFNTEEEI